MTALESRVAPGNAMSSALRFRNFNTVYNCSQFCQYSRGRELQTFGMKLKVGKLLVEQDIERGHLARKVGGPKFHLCTDSNQS